MNETELFRPIHDPKTFKELQSFSVYINLFSQTEINGMTRSVFKIIVEDNISHHKYIGYSLEKNKNNIDIFVNYVLSNLEMRDGLDKNYKLITGKDLTSHDPQSNVSIHKAKKNRVIQDNLSHREILGRIYKELIFNDGYAEMEGYSETKNPILPPIFIDSFISDFNKITKFTDYWRNQKISAQENEILKDTLVESGNEVEKYQDRFDFKKALKFYHRLNSAALELADSEKLSAQFVLKQVRIYFHLEEYEKCRNIIENNIKRFELFKLKEELGEFYYYLGMMSSYSNKMKEADAYFMSSTKLLMKSLNPENIFLYYNSRVRRLVIKKDYDKAIVIVNKALMTLSKAESEKELAELYGLKAEIYIRQHKLQIAIETLEIQLERAKNCNNKIMESRCITQMFSAKSQTNLISEEMAHDLLERVKILSKLINKSTYYYDSLISIAIFYHKKGNYDEAEKYFKKALTVYTQDSTNVASHIQNMTCLSIIRVHKKNYYGAIILLKKMLRLCDECSVTVYPAYIHNSLGRAYFDQNKFKTSNFHLQKVLKYITEDKLNDTVLSANTNAYLGLNNFNFKKYKISLTYLKKSVDLYEKNNKTDKNKDVVDRVVFLMSKIDEIKKIVGYF